MINLKKIDWGLLSLWMLLVITGIISIYTASVSSIGDYTQVGNYYIRQSIFFIVILPIFYLILRIPYYVIDALIVPAYLFSLLMLVIVLFTPEINGSHRWFRFLGINFQPSEFVKLASILMLAKYLSRPLLSDTRIIITGFSIMLPPIFLIMIEPDFGTTLVFWVILFFMLYATKIPLIYLLILIAPIISVSLTVFSPFYALIFIVIFLLVLLYNKFHWIIVSISTFANVFMSIMLWQILKPYQIQRILTFMDPTRDPLGAGYQVMQAKIAIGSGKIWGKGYLLGTQKNLNFLPEHHTDFIFSVIGEEFGFVLSMILIFLFFLLLLKIIKSLDKIMVPERKLSVVGIFAFILFQMFVNLGMNIGIVPTTGVPLPFISYGGSNLLINSMSIALIEKFIIEKGFLK